MKVGQKVWLRIWSETAPPYGQETALDFLFPCFLMVQFDWERVQFIVWGSFSLFIRNITCIYKVCDCRNGFPPTILGVGWSVPPPCIMIGNSFTLLKAIALLPIKVSINNTFSTSSCLDPRGLIGHQQALWGSDISRYLTQKEWEWDHNFHLSWGNFGYLQFSGRCPFGCTAVQPLCVDPRGFPDWWPFGRPGIWWFPLRWGGMGWDWISKPLDY